MFCIKPNQTLTQGRESWSKCTKIWNKKRFVISHHLNQACSDKGKKVQHFFANLFSSQYFFFFFFWKLQVTVVKATISGPNVFLELYMTMIYQSLR